MEKVVLTNKLMDGSNIISASITSDVYELRNGSILKVFRPGFLRLLALMDANIENKILEARPVKNAPEIIVPDKACYFGTDFRSFTGYICRKAEGKSFNELDSELSFSDREDLYQYAKRHKACEDVLVRAKSIVFPDFCSCDNIYFDSCGRVQFIDYDGLQVGKYRTTAMSTGLGDQSQYNVPKYFRNGLFTKNLDKKSSILLYFLSTFNLDLNRIGSVNPVTKRPITLDDAFSELGLDDADFCHKVWKIFQDKIDNDFLGDDVFRIADKYKMKVCYNKGDITVKKLEKK